MFGLGVPELIVLLLVIGIPTAIVFMVRRSKAGVNEASGDVEQVVSNGKRLANFIIDIILFRIMVILLVMLFAGTEIVQSLGQNSFTDALFGLFLFSFYYFFFETLFQRTPAKFITRTKVVMLDGSKPDASAILKRTLSRLVPFEPLSGNKGTWWHDRWTKTRVVKV